MKPRTGISTGTIELAPHRRRRDREKRRTEEREWRERSERAAPVVAEHVCEVCGRTGHRARYCFHQEAA